jgi:predicted metal-binding protein
MPMAQTAEGLAAEGFAAEGFAPEVCVHVCVTCKAGQVCDEEAERPGHRFRRALEDALAGSADAGWLEIREAACLASCERGCAAAISMPGKWSYLLGHLGEQKTADFLTYARAYRASKTGLVLPSKRPLSLHDLVLGRMPSLTPALEKMA